MSKQDNLNCLKNLMQLMCCDGAIHPREKAFLTQAAKELAVLVDDWNGLLQEVLHDKIPFYPVSDRTKAIAALQSLVVMAKSDGKTDEKEIQFVRNFAQSIGISKPEWKEAISHIDTENLFAPFQQPAGNLIALKDDFEKIEAFLKIAQDNGATVQVSDLKTYLQGAGGQDGIVCFHAAEEKGLTVSRCQALLTKTGIRLVCILNRFQGHQVKYLHEAGLKKCIIEPVYARDIAEIFKIPDSVH